MSGKKSENIRRTYSIKDISIVFAILIAIVLLFDSTGLKLWAERLKVGPSREFFVAATGPLYSFTSKLGLDTPRNVLRNAFFNIMGKNREAGFMLADSDGAAEQVGSWMNSPHVGWNANGADVGQISESETVGEFSSENPLKVLLIGDSMMGDGFGTEMEKALEGDNTMTSKRYPRHSSGLSRPDYYSWPAQVTEIFGNEEYDAVIVMLGTNDAQNFESDGIVYERFSDGWNEIYGKRLMNFLNLLSSKTQRVYWIGMPPMRDDDYDERIRKLNAFYEEGCRLNPEANYISTGEIIGDASGNFTSYLDIDGIRVGVRNTDGIHITRAAGALVADEVMELIKEDFDFTGEEAQDGGDLPPVF